MFSLLTYTVRHHARTARGSENSDHDKKKHFKHNKFFDTESGHIMEEDWLEGRACRAARRVICDLSVLRCYLFTDG